MKYFVSTEFKEVGNGPGYLARYIYENRIIPCVGYDVPNEEGNIEVRNRFRRYLGYFGMSIDIWLALRGPLKTRPKLVFNSSPLIWLFLFVYAPKNQFLLINDYSAVTSRFSITSRYKFRQWLIGIIEKQAAYRSINLIYNSHYTKEVFESRTNSSAVNRVIYKGVDFSMYPALHKELHVGDICHLLYIKSDITIGNLEVVLSFLDKEKQRYHLHVVGPSVDEVERILVGRVLPITVYGRLNTKEIIELCRSTIDVAVLISSKEALGLALIEMISMGMPVVSSNVGGMKEVSNDGLYTINLKDTNQHELSVVFDSLRERKVNLDLNEGIKYVRRNFSITQTVNEYLSL